MANRLVRMIDEQAARYGSREAFRFTYEKGGEWIGTSWADFRADVHRCAVALASVGLDESDRIAICSPNTPRILIAEFAAFRNRAAAIPIYSSSSQGQYDFIVNNGGATVLFVGNRHQYPLAYNYWKANPGKIKCIVAFEKDVTPEPDDTVTLGWEAFMALGSGASAEINAEVNARAERGSDSDMATLIYTSGTTGEPKGVVLPHSCYDATIDMHQRLLTSINDEDLSMAFLPMSHIFEKAWCFFCLSRGLRIAINYDPRYIQETIQQVHPNLMCCVPRFWEKVYTAVSDKIAHMSWLQRRMVHRAISVGRRRNLDYVRTGTKVPRLLESEYRFWDRRVFSLLKKAIGIPDPNFFPTAGAPLSDRITEFFRAVGIDIIIGYGLSETTATVTCFPQVGYEIGTVGIPLEHTKVRIDESGEILVKSPTVMQGYYENPDANRDAFTADGYFRTGDAGYLNPSGALVLTERVKDLFKTSNGKYIAPQALESRLAENKYIDEVAVIGDNRKFVTALVVPNFPNLEEWAKAHGITETDKGKLTSDNRVTAFVMKQIEPMQADMAPYERIKKITLLPDHFSVMNGEVTNTMKVRRPVVAAHYAPQIEAMYAE